MAVIQVSKIQVRSGLQQDLPALDTGEFGWSVDTQRLFIGKGTLAEGAPTTGVTEVMTEYSSGLLALSIDQLNANVANVVANVTTIQNTIGNLSPRSVTLADNQSSIANLAITVESSGAKSIDYRIVRGTTVRTGTIKATNYQGTSISFEDDYTETGSTGVTLYWTGNTVTNSAVLGYTTTSTGSTGNLTYTYQAFI